MSPGLTTNSIAETIPQRCPDNAVIALFELVLILARQAAREWEEAERISNRPDPPSAQEMLK